MMKPTLGQFGSRGCFGVVMCAAGDSAHPRGSCVLPNFVLTTRLGGTYV